MQPKIAVVEDEEALSVLLRYNLEAEGYEVDTVLPFLSQRAESGSRSHVSHEQQMCASFLLGGMKREEQVGGVVVYI